MSEEKIKEYILEILEDLYNNKISKEISKNSKFQFDVGEKMERDYFLTTERIGFSKWCEDDIVSH